MRNIFLILGLVFLVSKSNAADIFRTELRNNIYQINIEGTIQRGDADNFIRLIFSSKPGSVFRRVGLNSNGGDVDEAIKLASLVEQLRLRTKVNPGGVCASACFFIWVVGEPHNATSQISSQYLGRVGLHRPYLKNPKNDPKSLETQGVLQKQIANFLSEKLIPNRLIDLMMTRPSNDIYWLTKQDLDELGEYSAPVEELYINKCQYNRKHDYMLAELDLQNRHEEFARLKRKVDASDDCLGEISFERGLEGLKSFVAKYGKLYATEQKNNLPNSEDDESALVDRVHPNWMSIVKTQKFRNWYDSQSLDIQKLSQSPKAVDAIKMLDKFKADTKYKN